MNENSENLMIGNLQRMYHQTQHWIADIKLYEEELNFFNSQIAEKINTTTTEDLNHKEIYRNMDTVLYKLSEDLVNQIRAHGKDLLKLIEEKDISNKHTCSRDHIHLLEKMALLKKNIKKLKKALFKYIKNHPFDFDFDGLLNEL